MTLSQLAGAVLVAVPFLVLIGLMARTAGWKVALLCWGVAGIGTLALAAGAFLLTGEWS